MKWHLVPSQWERRQQALSSLADSYQRISELETPPEPIEMLAHLARGIVRQAERTLFEPDEVVRIPAGQPIDGEFYDDD